ncbi:MaoC/PaaZ C-terminal domain-containing protein [Leifsonia kafniensis]
MDVEQQQVDMFADAVADHQWIHVDPVKAASGPYGGPIVHGYLALALFEPLWRSVLAVRGGRSGAMLTDKVRFLSPVRVGSRVRLAASVSSILATADGFRLTVAAQVEIQGMEKPALAVQCRRDVLRDDPIAS